MASINRLESIVERIDTYLTEKTGVRDLTLSRSRTLIRYCANSIRATHRHEYDDARALLEQAKEAARVMKEDASQFADVEHAGYLHDAVKELAEAAITLALVTEKPLPGPEYLNVDYVSYLNGLGEAMGEMRRFSLDAIRRGDIATAERLLACMDEVYSHLVTIDYPDSLTRGLRRTTDMVRGVTERTRGDLTTAVRQEQLQQALRRVEGRLDVGESEA